MIDADDLEIPAKYRAFLDEWAKRLNVSVEVLVGRIVVAAIDGQLYVEKIPDYCP